MRRQESVQVEGKSAGRNEAGTRSEMQQLTGRNAAIRKLFYASRPRQWWPLVETVLRTGCIKTICHPFQVHAGVPPVNIGDL